jgi:threonine synthase
MKQAIRFYSTNRNVPTVTLDQALLQGQAGDKGLFLPETYPVFSADELKTLAGKPYAEVAFAILREYTHGVIDRATLRSLCEDAYDYPVPLEQVTRWLHLMRLDRGPTASFKDFAARMMARWMGALLREQGGAELVILTATSGDTGSAVAHAYHGVTGVRVVVLFPPAEVSDRQRKQMTTIGDNVTTIAVDGKFDDCQALVKQAFADPELAHIRLSSANSINIGRLLPQSVYYVYAYVNLAEHVGLGGPTLPGPGGPTLQVLGGPTLQGEPITFCVPSGNFGDMMGAVIARRMGVPIERIIIATNANDEVPIFLRTGEYRKIVPSRTCISNAMNVGHPSNLARLVDLYGGWLDETGTVRKQPDLDAMRRDFYAVSISDDETRATIKSVYERYGVILEPHGAVGWAGVEHFLRDHPAKRDALIVSVETAHPAKFPEEVQAAIGVVPEVPPSLAGLEQRQESYETMPAEYEPFRAWLLSRFGGVSA